MGGVCPNGCCNCCTCECLAPRRWWRRTVRGLRSLLSCGRLRRQRSSWDLPPPQLCEFADPEMGFAIYNNFPIDIVKTLDFVSPHTKRLIIEFWYKHSGEVEYEEPAQEEGWRYARLITKSSHYIELGQVLRTVAMQVAEFMAQTSYATSCLAERYEGSMDTHRTIYAVLVFSKVAILVLMSLDKARAAFAADPGDFGGELNARDYLKRLIQATFFYMFDVPALVADLPVLIHIKKAVQPFVACRSKDGIRAWIVGYQSSAQYEVEVGGETMGGLLLKILIEPLIAAVTIMLGAGEGFTVDVIASLFWSIMSVYASVINVFKLNHARQEYRRSLAHEINHLNDKLTHQGAEEDGEGGEIVQQTRQELKVMYRQFARFFPLLSTPPDPHGVAQEFLDQGTDDDLIDTSQDRGHHDPQTWYRHCQSQLRRVIDKYEGREAELYSVVQRKSQGLRTIIGQEPVPTDSARAASAPLQRLLPFPDAAVSHAAPARLAMGTHGGSFGDAPGSASSANSSPLLSQP